MIPHFEGEKNHVNPEFLEVSRFFFQKILRRSIICDCNTVWCVWYIRITMIPLENNTTQIPKHNLPEVTRVYMYHEICLQCSSVSFPSLLHALITHSHRQLFLVVFRESHIPSSPQSQWRCEPAKVSAHCQRWIAMAKPHHKMHTSYGCPFWYNVWAEQHLSAPFSGNIFHLYLHLPHNLFCKNLQKQPNLLGHSERKDSRFFSQPEKSWLPYITE